MRSRRLAKKEQELLEKKGAGLLQNYNVMKNVSTHSIIRAPDADHRHGKPTLSFPQVYGQIYTLFQKIVKFEM